MEHLKLYANGYSIIAFNQMEKYQKEGAPINLDVIGTLSKNVYQNTMELQVEANDFHRRNDCKKIMTSLQEALRRNGTI